MLASDLNQEPIRPPPTAGIPSETKTRPPEASAAEVPPQPSGNGPRVYSRLPVEHDADLLLWKAQGLSLRDMEKRLRDRGVKTSYMSVSRRLEMIQRSSSPMDLTDEGIRTFSLNLQDLDEIECRLRQVEELSFRGDRRRGLPPNPALAYQALSRRAAIVLTKHRLLRAIGNSSGPARKPNVAPDAMPREQATAHTRPAWPPLREASDRGAAGSSGVTPAVTPPVTGAAPGPTGSTQPPAPAERVVSAAVTPSVTSVPHAAASAPAEPPRNRPCPCGSGRKYKRCCGATAEGKEATDGD